MSSTFSWHVVATFETLEQAAAGRSQILATGIPARVLSQSQEPTLSGAFLLQVPQERLAEAEAILSSEPLSHCPDFKPCPDICTNCGAPRSVPNATGLGAIAERFLPGPAVLRSLPCELCGFDPGWQRQT